MLFKNLVLISLLYWNSGYGQIPDVLPNGSIFSDPPALARANTQKSNQDFYTRVSQFSPISWATLPFCDLGSSKGGYIVSADIQPHFFIGGEKFPITISITPRYKVRIFRDNLAKGDSSLPVRTPSFIPGGTISIPINIGEFSPYRNIQYLSLAVFHHSNGQDHPTFTSPGNFNFYNGNFSTNFFELSYSKNWRIENHPPAEEDFFCATEYLHGYWDRVVKIGLEQHFSTAYAQRGTYGRTRLNFNGQYIKVKNCRSLIRRTNSAQYHQVGNCYLREQWRGIANLSLNVDKLQDPYNHLSHRVNAEIGGFLRIGAASTSFFVMVGYYGNDPYNIYYSKSYAFIRTGLALGIFAHTLKL